MSAEIDEGEPDGCVATDMPARVCAEERESSDLWVERRSGRSATVWRFWIQEKKSHTFDRVKDDVKTITKPTPENLLNDVSGYFVS